MKQNLWRPDDFRRWTDEKGRPVTLVSITIRTNHGRMGLTPTRRNNELIVGVLGRAAEKYDFEIYHVAFMGNHVHYIIAVRSAQHESWIKNYIHSNIARELLHHGFYGSEHRGLKLFGHLWDRGSSSSIAILDDAALIQRFRYVMSNGTKEGIVAHPIRMPSVHGARPLCEGHRELRGVWYDRSKLCRLRIERGVAVPEQECATVYTVKLSKLPPLRHLSDEAYAAFCRDMADEIAVESRLKLVDEYGPQFRPQGARAWLKISPFHIPGKLKRTPAPLVHATEEDTRQDYLEGYRTFVTAYQAAHRRLRDALRDGRRIRVEFPHGGVPPTGLLAG